MGPSFKYSKFIAALFSALVVALAIRMLFDHAKPTVQKISDNSLSESNQVEHTIALQSPSSIPKPKDKTHPLASAKTPKIFAEKHFEDETRDEPWASTTEAKLYSLFYESEALSSYSVSNIECRSEQCYMTVYLNSSSPRHKLALSLKHEIVSHEIACNSIILLEIQDDYIRLLIGRDQVNI